MSKSKLNCWIVCEDGLTGTLNQCIGVAEALGLEYTQKNITLTQPWKSLSPYLGFERNNSFLPRLDGPWPDLVIAGGRKSIAACRYIKKKNPACFVTFLQDPRISTKHFDLVAVPAHDPARGDNVIVTSATPNRVTKEKLEKAKREFAAFGQLPEPRVAVLIGGDSKAYSLTHSVMVKLALRLDDLKGAGLMISTSRRTGAENEKVLREHLDMDKHFMWDGHDPNPYFGMLAWADYIIVTADSASMLSDACTSGKPVYMVEMKAVNPKKTQRIDKLHQNLQDLGAMRVFKGMLEPFEYTPFNDAKMIANEIRKRMNL